MTGPADDTPRRDRPAVGPVGPALREVQVAVGQWLDRYAGRGRGITVACSGGADSLALAAATASEAPRQGHPIHAVTVDHGLQPGSAVRAARTAELLHELGFDRVDIATVDVGTVGGPEAAARTARYAALHPLARGGAVLLGHTLDDQAETVLLGLGRGSGPRSIAGMRPWSAPYGRPLLGLRRRQTEEACAEAGLMPWQDGHNADPRFTRVRLRQEVLPLLEQVLGGGVAPALARTAEQIDEDLQALDALAATALAAAARPGPGGMHLERETLTHHPPAIRRRVLRLWLTALGVRGLTDQHLRRVDALAVGPAGVGPVRLPGHLDAGVDGERLCLRTAAQRPGGSSPAATSDRSK